MSQFFGEPTAGTIQVLVSRSSAHLLATVAQPCSLISASLVTQAAIPSTEDGGAWALSPGTLDEATVSAEQCLSVRPCLSLTRVKLKPLGARTLF